MSPHSMDSPGDILIKTSRRRFLKKGASFTAAAPWLASAEQTHRSPAPGRVLAYVGTTSMKEGPPDYLGNGQGIYLFEMEPATGTLSWRETFASASNPSWLAFDPSRTHLYSVNEITSFEGTNSGAVSAYRIERPTGRLTLLNTLSSQGAGPTQMSVHPSGKFALVANYVGGTVAVLPIRAQGELGPATDVFGTRGQWVLSMPPAHRQGVSPSAGTISPTRTWCNRMCRAVSCLPVIWRLIGRSFSSSTPKRAR